jgi:hypothetical protein
MLGSAAFELPGRSRLGLKVAAGGGAATEVPASPMLMPATKDAIATTIAGRENLAFITSTSF